MSGLLTAELPYRPTWRERWLTPRRTAALTFVLPAFLLLFLVTIYPLLYTLRLAFMQWELSTPVPATFVGLDNFARILSFDAEIVPADSEANTDLDRDFRPLLTIPVGSSTFILNMRADERFWGSLQTTIVLIVSGVALELVLGVGIALMLNEVARFRAPLVALFLVPVMIAPVVSGYMFKLILNTDVGPLNYLIYALSGGTSRGLGWLSSPELALFSIMLTTLWQWTPFTILITLAGLQSVPHEILEAAQVDGATGWTTFWSVKLPLLLPVLSVGLLIRIMDTFKTFDLVYLLTAGGPGSATETVAYYTYIEGFKTFSMGYTAALAFLQLIIITIIARTILSIQRNQRGEVNA